MYKMVSYLRLNIDFHSVIFRDRAREYARYYLARKGQHMNYFIKFVICEALNIISLMLVFYFTDKFLNGTFATYGQDVLNYMSYKDIRKTQHDPKCNAFPTTVRIYFDAVFHPNS